MPVLPNRALLSTLFLCLAACQTATPAGATANLTTIGEDVTLVTDLPRPRFKVDTSWPKLPENMVVGQVSGVSIDRDGNIWIVQRRDTVRNLPAGKEAAPHVLKFSPAGDLLASWGGPSHAPEIDGVNQWPVNVHGLFVDDRNTVWIGGNGAGDHVVINLTTDGKYIGQIGKRTKTAGNLDKETLGGPADAYSDGETVFIADGYTNKRIVAAHAHDHSFKAYWGAFATRPDAPSRVGDFDQSMASSDADGGANLESRMFGDIVHCVTKNKAGEIFVCDRRNNRVQIFRMDEKGEVSFVHNLPVAPETGGLRTASDVTFSPDEKYMYIADMANERIWILLAETKQYLGYFGKAGKAPGEFTWLHSVVADSQGNLYTTEVNGGQRAQKFVLTGIE